MFKKLEEPNNTQMYVIYILLTMATPLSSTLLNLTMRMEMMTEVRGAMAETQKSFGFFLAWSVCHIIRGQDESQNILLLLLSNQIFVLDQADMLKNWLEKLQLTIYLVSRRKAKKARPMMIVRQLHYKANILNGKKII